MEFGRGGAETGRGRSIDFCSGRNYNARGKEDAMLTARGQPKRLAKSLKNAAIEATMRSFPASRGMCGVCSVTNTDGVATQSRKNANDAKAPFVL